MSRAAGTRLGPYEIRAPLGAGGMGEVYRAKDTRLGREVALKILPEEVSQDQERLARFDGEARTASALNHPNIVTIHDIGREGSVSYIAMELVEGRTLRDLLADGPLPLRRLLGIAGQIADGLARAHEAGIVHRDLKPDNVMVTREGLVKILDFGLAKLAAPASLEVSQVATAVDATRPGVVLGTAGYMSPEQASGKPLDFRSDQFSFGSILYEMAAGRRAFSRGTAAETLAAVIRDEPEPLRAAVPAIPGALRWIIDRCLAKDPEERYASTRDLARDLANLRDRASELSLETSPSAVPPRRRFLLPAVLGLGALAAVALLALTLSRDRPDESAGPIRFSVPLPPDTNYAPSEISRGFSISPDGTRLGIEAYIEGRRHLFVRPLDSEQSARLEGTADASAHFWSPDSRFIAFHADGKLKKIPSEGGVAEDICPANFEIVGTWSRDGTILFTQLYPAGIYRVSDKGGKVETATSPEAGKAVHIWPQFLPDGRRFLYLALGFPQTERGERTLLLGSLDSTETRTLARLDSRFEYAPTGHLVYVRDGALFAQPFDERKAAFSGEPRRLVESVHYFNGPANAGFSVSQTGAIAYAAPQPVSRVAWFDRSGKEVGQLGQPSVVDGLRISPDGEKVAVDIEVRTSGTSDLWVFDIARGVSTRLNHDSVDEAAPVWSPDGTKLFFRSDALGAPDVFEMEVGVPGSERLLLQDALVQQPEDVSRDGRLLVYLNDMQTKGGLFLLPIHGERKPRPWLRTRFTETSPRFSPDGRWIAYESDESGDPEVYVALTEGGGDKRRISPAGGRRPRWRGDGRELYYLSPDGFVMAAPVAPGTGLQVGVPVRLFRVEPQVQNYDVSPDGSRFLVSTFLEKTPASPLRVILNWPAALK